VQGESSFSAEKLTVPLIVNRTILGAVSVRSDGRSEFDRHHLHLTAAAAATAAAAIDNARREERLTRRMSLLEQERHWFADLTGDSPQARSIRRRVEEIAASAAPALISGPPGVGKDGAGRAIHSKSAFSQGPFVLARVLGRNQETLEKLLFGADSDAGVEMGWLDQAEGGTLFLDRIEGLGPELQQRFYAMLETGDFARKGGGSVAQARCRIIVSTGELIESAVAANEFYPELYLRLKGLSVHMPGLRERPGDIRDMAQALASRFAEHAGRAFECFSESALVALTVYEWPDNVRELESVIRAAELRRSGLRIELEDLPEEVSEALNPDAPGSYHHEVREARRQIILTAMEKARGSYSAAADLLRINRTYLHRLIRNLGLRDEIGDRFGRE
jgi:DNA-binding NtrC family response regulator